MIQPPISILGVMSGSSLDGLDFSVVKFSDLSSYLWKLEEFLHVPFPIALEEKIRQATHLCGQDLWQLHHDFGHFIGEVAHDFISEKSLQIDYIASHGHTIFHQPSGKLTCQIGHGACIAQSSGIKTICDFRTTDTAHGGQGAPLAPLADKLLFPSYSAFLNIGGIANCSIIDTKTISGFDICPANQLLNLVAKDLGLQYDDKGSIARSGRINTPLFDKLHQWSQNHEHSSISNNDIEQELFPLLKQATEIAPADKLCTITNYIAQQVCDAFSKHPKERVLCTGGGTYNDFLLELMNKGSVDFIAADKPIIEHKEAILMALAGLRRLQELPIFYQTVTGAPKDVSGGCVYLPL